MATTYTDAAISMTNGTNTVVVRPRTLAKNVYLETAVGDSAVGSTLTSALTKIDTAIDNVKKDVSDGMNSVGTAITAKGSSVPTNPTFSDLVTGVNNIETITYSSASTSTFSGYSLIHPSKLNWSEYIWTGNIPILAVADVLGYNYDSATQYLYLESGMTSAQLTTIGYHNLKMYRNSPGNLIIESLYGTIEVPASGGIIYYIKTDDFCIFTTNIVSDYNIDPSTIFCYIVGSNGRYYKQYNYPNYLTYTDTTNVVEKSCMYDMLTKGIGVYSSSYNNVLGLSYLYDYDESTPINTSVLTISGIGTSDQITLPLKAYGLQVGSSYYLILGLFIPVSGERIINDDFLPLIFPAEKAKSYLKQFVLNTSVQTLDIAIGGE